MRDFRKGAIFDIMLTYIIPVLIITLVIIVYGLLNVEKDDSGPEEENPGCDHCGEKDSCGANSHDSHAHFAIHKPDMTPADGLFKKKESGD
ncbi:MAG: hypothetical protein ABIJ42_03480 [Acidobacteriota bacterium]